MKYHRGYSLIELMISTVVALLVLGGAFQVVIDSKQNQREEAAISAIQDNARYALHVLTQDLFLAGYWGCSTRDTAGVANTLRTNDGGFVNFLPITGFEGQDSIIDFPVDLQARAIKGSDAFIVRHADSRQAFNVEKHKPASATIHLWGNHNFNVGDALVISEANCRQIGIFEMSGPNNSPAKTIVHNTNNGGGNASDNCTKDLKGNFSCSAACNATGCPDSSSSPYGPGSKVMRFVANAYYIGRSTVYAGTALEDTPILFRQELSSEGVQKTKAVEIAEGVERLDMIYGVDNDTDGEVDQFLRADAMDLDNSGFITSDEWEKVIAVRISLIFKSTDPIYGAPEKTTIEGVDYEDRYLRKGFSQTVQLRNHG